MIVRFAFIIKCQNMNGDIVIGKYKKMAKLKKYSLTDIDALWKAYTSKKVLRIRKGGKFSVQELNGKGVPRLDGATSAEVIDLHKEISFPNFVKKYG
jgi:hypothetical protein